MFFPSKKASHPTKTDPTVRRSHLSKELVTDPAEGEVQTVADVLPYTAKRYANRTAAYTRKIINVVEEKKRVPKKDGKEGETEEKVWKFFTLSEPTAVTYSQLYETVRQTSSGLRKLGVGRRARTSSSLDAGGNDGPVVDSGGKEDGLEDDSDEDGRSRCGIYAETSLNWQIMSHSLARMGHPLTTAYTTLGPEGLQHSLVEPSVRMLFTNAQLLPTLLKVLPEAKSVRFVVYDLEEDADQAVVDKINAILKERDGRAETLTEVQHLGRANPLEDDDFGPRPKRSDLYCIMYTSGSTGAPKGVMLTHDNIVCSLAGTKTLLKPLFRDDDFFLAFLPLAHILELLVEMTFYFCGVPVGYGTVKTLTQDSVRQCDGDLVAYKPTIIVGVPAVFELIRKGMVKKIHESPSAVQTVFNLAYTIKRNVPLMGGVLDKAVFAKVKAATGGNLRLAMNGGAALSKATQDFLSTVLVTTLQGYGATETCGMCAILVPEFYQPNSVGVIVPSMEVKLHDYPEAGYLNSNTPPQGEIWLRGGSVTKGYYKRPDLNKETFTEDGWFKTGDIGQFRADGTLSIIDRIKNLVKLRSGEYLALEKLESTYGSCNIVQSMILYADSDADKPVAIVVPHEGNLRNKLKSSNAPSEGDLETLCKRDDVRELVKSELLNVGEQGGLKGPELLTAVVLDGELWTPDNGRTTATNKPQRSAIKKEFQKQVDAAYGRK